MNSLLVLPFSFKSRKSKQTKIFFIFKTKLNSKTNKIKIYFYSFVWFAIITSGIRRCDSASNYVLILGKLFHLYKLIHIAEKPRILVASFLLVSLLNVNVFFIFLDFGLVFLRAKGLPYIDALLHRVIVWNETLNDITWFCYSK